MVQLIPKISVKIIETPVSLVHIQKTYSISFEIKNTGSLAGSFQIDYKPVGAQIKSSDLQAQKFQLTPNSSIIDRIKLIPIQKGLISLNLKIVYLKEIVKEVIRPNQSPSLSPSPNRAPSEPDSPISSVFQDHFPSDISEALEDILLTKEDTSEIRGSSPTLSSSAPEPVIEKVVEIISKEIYSTTIFLNALDKESSANIKEFAKKGDSNILASEMGLPFCVCYFYSAIQEDKWKIRPALIRNICLRMKEKFGKFGYYLSYPISKQLDEHEIQIIREAIQTFVVPHSSHAAPMLILNLDVIPELEKPTIILGYEPSGIYLPIKNLLHDIFGAAVNVFMDDCIFSGGLLYNFLVEWVKPNPAQILNFVISNNFLMDFDLFQNLMEILISFSLGES
ncbi:MAG: hypothetical protein ACTSRS_19970 [Candidatus Helarchaeota archaeon]